MFIILLLIITIFYKSYAKSTDKYVTTGSPLSLHSNFRFVMNNNHGEEVTEAIHNTKFISELDKHSKNKHGKLRSCNLIMNKSTDSLFEIIVSDESNSCQISSSTIDGLIKGINSLDSMIEVEKGLVQINHGNIDIRKINFDNRNKVSWMHQETKQAVPFSFEHHFFPKYQVYSEPSAEPSAEPSVEPSVEPTQAPTEAPTEFSFSFSNQVITKSMAFSASLSIASLTPTVSPTMSPTIEEGTRPPSFTAAPSSVPTNSPTYPLTSVPTDIPTLAPTAAVSSVPTNLPTNPLTSVPTDVPTLAPTTAPTFKPSPKPTNQKAPIVTFNTEFTMNGVTSPELTETAEQAVIDTYAMTLGADPSSFAVVGYSIAGNDTADNSTDDSRRSLISWLFLHKPATVTDQRSIDAKIKVSRTSSVNVDNISRKLQDPETYDLDVVVQAILNMVDYSEFGDDADALYAQLTSQLSAAVNSGNFTETLVQISLDLGADELTAVEISGMNFGELSVEDTPDDDNGSSGGGGSNSGLAIGAIVGIVVGVVVLIAIIIAVVYYFAFVSAANYPGKVSAEIHVSKGKEEYAVVPTANQIEV